MAIRIAVVPLGVVVLFLALLFIGLAGYATHGQSATDQLRAGLDVLLVGAALGSAGLMLLTVGFAGLGRRRLGAAAVIGAIPAVGYAVAILTDRF